MPVALGLPGVLVVVGLVSAAGHGLWSLVRDRRRRGRRRRRTHGDGGWGDVIADSLEAVEQPDDAVVHHRHHGGLSLDDHGGWHGHHDGGGHDGGYHDGGGHDGGGHDGGD